MSYAVLVIDVQRGLFEPLPRPFEAEEVVQRINMVTATARSSGKPVVFVQHEQNGTVLEFQSEGWELQAGLEIAKDDYFVRKTTPDSFQGTILQQLLVEHSIHTLLVCGYASEFCVDTTVRRAATLGFSVQIVGDAHTTHDKDHLSAAEIRVHHNETLRNVRSFGQEIRVVASNEVAREI